MNVLNEAMMYVNDLQPNQNISIKSEKMVNTGGFPIGTDLPTIKAIAHVQPIGPFELKKLGVADIGSSSYFRFWVIDNLAEVLNYINNTSSKIIWGDRNFDVFSKADWSLNGWIEVIGTEVIENV